MQNVNDSLQTFFHVFETQGIILNVKLMSTGKSHISRANRIHVARYNHNGNYSFTDISQSSGHSTSKEALRK